MASSFCTQCGSPVDVDARFCPKCGNPTASAASPPAAPAASAAGLPAGPPTAAPLPTAVPTGPPLSSALGLDGAKSFVVQHQLLSMGHSYRVMDTSKRHLFTVQGNTGQNLRSNLLGSLAGGSDSYIGRMVGRSVDMSYEVVDAQGTPRGAIHKQGGANSAEFTLADATGAALVRIAVQRGLMGGITATAVGPDGQPLMATEGNLLRHNFTIKNGQGAPLAKVHEAWVAVRDTYQLDLEGAIDPLYPLVFAILIDYEKVK